MRYLFVISLLLFFGCSTKSPQNKWQYQSYNSYKSFEKYFLEYKLDLAAIELDRARESAKVSANLDTLARIELSKCALQVALLQEFTCKDYDSLKSLIKDNELSSYYNFLSVKFDKNDLNNLPKQYHSFAEAFLSKDLKSMKKSLKTVEPFTSQMIAASLIKEELDESTISMIVDKASFRGYRYAVIVWLNFQIDQSDDPQERELLKEKLKIISPEI